MDLPFLGTGVFDSEGVLELAPKVVDGAVFSAPAFAPDCEEPACREFVEAYRAAHDADPNQFQAHAWDAVHILAKAIAEGGYDGVAIRDAIRQIGTFDGAAGETTFKEDGTSVKPVAVKRIEGGTAETIDTVEP
jgi:branched-chain amino acid transport system substrate-binding protein